MAMILVSGASGKSGAMILQALARKGLPVRALVHRQEQVGAALAAGAVEAHCGDLENGSDLERAMMGVEKVYHICPNMHPRETQIGMQVIEAAKKHGVSHFVYHSVLHPQIEAMPHHWNKLRVEEYLFTSGLPFTILQPCAYMQNIAGYMPLIMREGVYSVPYAPETPISIVDLEDVATSAARVLSEEGHQGATYELSGPQPLTQVDLAQVLARLLGRDVSALAVDRSSWIENARRGGMTPYALETLVKMFEYYEQFGFTGCPRVLEWLLGRPPATFEAYIRWNFSGEKTNG
jgi:NAD(P)H dehydrogenase (quinone)